ncbi:hypothetical protein [Bacillus sp. 165]|nr:hypothetical protein [Bacillus sp. 165]
MALSDLPTIKPPKGVVFLSAVALSALVFFFTQPKSEDASERSKK